jgi:hypothetical protein
VILDVQVDIAGAVTVTVWLAGVSVVVTPPSTEDPVALTDATEFAREEIGPTPVGHEYTAVTFVHNCGASPTTRTWADAVVIEPVIPSNATSNVGLDPVSVGESVAKFKAVLSVSETSVQPEIATPEEFLTVSFAAVKVPVPALVNLKDSH